MTPLSINTAKAVVSLSEEGHVYIRINENEDIDRDDIASIQVAKKELIGNQLHTVIFFTPKFGNISAAAREYSASKEVSQNVIARAIITKSLSSRMISNFFIRINRPSTPTRLFETEEEAVTWLNKVLSKVKV